MNRDVMQEIRREVEDNPVVLYMKGNKLMPQCGFSASAVAVLEQLGVTFKDVDVLKDPEKREAIKRFGDWPTLPQLYVHGELVGGADIMREMLTTGELARRLERSTS